MVVKTARKPSQDPTQEKLRQNKALWNKEVSTFVNDLIHLKKMMNGWPSKFHKERSRIVEPIPADPATIIGSLASDFNEIAQRGNSIVQEQVNYAKTRRKKQPKQLNLPNVSQTPQAAPEAAPPAPDLSKQLSLPAVASSEYELVSEASNPLTRFFARILNVGIGGSEKARIKKYRMSLLSAAAQSYKDLEKLQANVVGSGAKSIFHSSQLLGKIENNWVFFTNGFATYKDSMPNEGKGADTGGDLPAPDLGKPKGQEQAQPPAAAPPSDGAQFNLDEAGLIMNDYMNTNVSGLYDKFPPDKFQRFHSIANKYRNTTDPHKRVMLSKELASQYHALRAALNKTFGTNGNTLAEIVSSIKPEAATPPPPPPATASPEDQLEKLAQDFLKRWYGKTKHQINPFDKTSAMRLDLYNKADETKKILDEIMDHLEKGLVVDFLSPLVNKISLNMMIMKKTMGGLEATVRGVGFEQPFMSLLEKGRIGDHAIDLTPEQKKKLQRALELRRMRDLTNMYSGR
jgi:hypothetical protein